MVFRGWRTQQYGRCGLRHGVRILPTSLSEHFPTAMTNTVRQEHVVCRLWSPIDERCQETKRIDVAWGLSTRQLAQSQHHRVAGLQKCVNALLMLVHGASSCHLLL